jgi:integrase
VTKRERIEQGLYVRHAKGCATEADGRCNCEPSYMARAWSAGAGREVRRSFKRKADAKAWRARMMSGHADRVAGATGSPVLDVLAEQVFDQAKAGVLLNRSGDPYKPSVVRSYRSSYDQHVSPLIGGRRVSTITRRDVQVIVNEAKARGLSASTVRNALMPLRLIMRVAIRDELGVGESPINMVELPAVRGRRERYAAPTEIPELLAALAPEDRGLWATAIYAGLRRGELMALSTQAVDLDAGMIYVRQGYDPHSKTFITPKSAAGVRTVPIVKALRVHLLEHRMLTRRRDGLMFARPDGRPFASETITKRATAAWKNAKLTRITLHECRHTFASLMIAAGVNAKTLQEIGGWSSIAIVYDRYGHLMPGARDEAAGLLDAYLEREQTARPV